MIHSPSLICSRSERCIALLAFFSGVPSLIYQVVWAREVALLAGSHVEAISVVLVAFFGGLALGAHRLGVLADRVASPLRLYGVLEIASGSSALLSVWVLRALGESLPLSAGGLLAICGGVLLPVTFLLGGTLPALLCSISRQSAGVARHAGRIVGANTAGAVVGVAVAVAAIPALGLRASLLIAGAMALGVGFLAIALGRPTGQATEAGRADVRLAPQRGALFAAALAGCATLGYEVLATRLAMLRLGSSLYAWGLVLGLFLTGLAIGNLALAHWAKRTSRPAQGLGWIEVGAACGIALGLTVFQPNVAAPAMGLSWSAVLPVVAGVFPAAVAMGGAFPFLVRLAVAGSKIGGSFGRVSALNTAGGIAGALLAPFVLLPALGTLGSVLACAALNALIGLYFLAARSRPAFRNAGWAAAVLCLCAACVASFLPAAPSESAWVLFLAEGRQATAVVVGAHENRSLIVDGDPEASTAGNARRTEELMAVLPLLLHREPRDFLELGLGSGITLATAGRFALERVECVEIAGSVIRAARYFEPDNRAVAGPAGARIVHGDARIFLARHPGSYDVISANTLHPWSVGATGLYSREYFGRVSRALRSEGLVVQWLPTEQIGSDSLELILRTFYDVFPEGGLWWGAGNLIAVGALSPISAPEAELMTARLAEAGLTWKSLGMGGARDLWARRIADAAAVRAALGEGETLSDDRPVLEVRAARRRSTQRSAQLYHLLVQIARVGARESAQRGAVLPWLESLEARVSGDEKQADLHESLAAAQGWVEAKRARAERLASGAHRDFERGRLGAAEAGFRQALTVDPEQRDARFGLAGLAVHRGALTSASEELRTLLEQTPNDARAHNELSGVLFRLGERAAAGRANERALRLNPFYLEALANAGLMAADVGNLAKGHAMLARIRAVSPLGSSAQERALAGALESATKR